MKKKKKTKSELKKEAQLFKLLSFFHCYPQGAAISLPEKFKHEAPHFRVAKGWTVPKALLALSEQYLKEVEPYVITIPPKSKRGKTKEKVVSFYVLAEEGERWLTQYEDNQLEELRTAWKEKAKSAQGLLSAVDKYQQSTDERFSFWQKLLSPAEEFAQQDIDSFANSLSAPLYQALEETQERILAQVTTQIQQAMSEIQLNLTLQIQRAIDEIQPKLKEQLNLTVQATSSEMGEAQQKLTEQIQKSLQTTSSVTRELSGNLCRMKNEMLQLSSQSKLLAEIAKECIPGYYLEQEPDFSKMLTLKKQQLEKTDLVQGPTSKVTSKLVIDEQAHESSGATESDGTLIAWDDLLIRTLELIPVDEWIDILELHKALFKQGVIVRPGLIKDVVQALDAEKLVTLGPWTESIYELPFPQYAILQPQNNIIYFVRRSS